MEVEAKGTVVSECEVSKAGHSDIEGFKRARVENLVSIIRETPSRATPVDSFQPQVVNGCKKRKFYQPQQHEPKYNNSVQETTRSHAEDNCQSTQLGEEWKVKVSEMQLQIATIQRKLIDLYNVQSSNCEYSPKTIYNQNTPVYPSMAIEPLIGSTAAACNIDSITCSDWECLADNLKAGMSTLIDDWVRKHETSMQANDQTPSKPLIPKVSSTSCKPSPVTSYYSSRFLDSHSNRLPVFPLTYAHLSRPSTPVCSSHDGDDSGPISLVMSPKKKRVKVTDKVAIRTLNRYTDISNDCTSSDSTVPSTLSTSVAIPNPSLTLSGLHLRAVDVVRNVSPDSSPFKSETSDYFQDNVTYTSTLTPRHLRKAKLMFFYVRYPSSSVLKDNFPDIKFNKSNTAQLVKWFSNFREFYYIQMEKYARQALNDGCKSADDVTVGVDSEIYRVLSLHYNRNSHIKVPPNFRYVVEQTLKEFFGAIATGRNNEPSWKKVIYKIIARLDDNLPDIFKTSNFLEQLE